MLIGDALLAAQTRLTSVSDSPRADAELLLGHLLGLTRAQLFVRHRELLGDRDLTVFEQCLQRREQGEPVAYLTGEKGFWTLTLKVSPAVLVPRPETELLVEWALECIAARERPRVADLGTGSGAIALALASERSDAAIVATDLSNDALRVARGNAIALGLTQTEFRCGCWTQALNDECFDLVVSNPPYVARGDDHLRALLHEPLMALTDGADGLNALREIIADVPAHLNDGACLLVEHGYDQGEPVRELFLQAGFVDVTTRRDLGGQERCSGGRWHV